MIAEQFQVSVPTVTEHLASIYSEGEADREATIRSFRIVQREGRRDVSRAVEHYSLDAILAVGYRVRSHRGTAFRQWATARLGELLVKGFTLDDERLKAGQPLGAHYFDVLLMQKVKGLRTRRWYMEQTLKDPDIFDFLTLTDPFQERELDKPIGISTYELARALPAPHTGRP